MCVAISGQVLSISGDTAQVDIKGNKMPVKIGVVKPQPGDYVLVHAGYAVEIVNMGLAAEIQDLFAEVEEAFDELHN